MRSTARSISILLLSSLATSCGKNTTAPSEPDDPPEVAAGERLFLESRFAQFFAAHSPGAENAHLASGDPALDVTVSVNEDLSGPFKGLAMNCRACHLVDEHRDTPGGGVRTYSDFARRSPVPARADGRTTTPRNSPPLVNSTLARSVPLFLHFDGEFATLEDLIKTTFTGRNFGWLPSETAAARAQIAAVIRHDNGSGDLAKDFGGLPYPTLLKATASGIPDKYRLPQSFRLDVTVATDDMIVDAVARLVAAYVDSLLFSKDGNGLYNATPYDVFLVKNGLPRAPEGGEGELDYARRLRGLINGLSGPVWVDGDDGAFTLHDQAFEFGAKQLTGLKVFLAEPATTPPDSGTLAAGGVGNCIICHRPPNFTDFGFHNVGVTQEEYDGIHGAGGFAAVTIPTFTQRSATPDSFLPASSLRPGGLGPFLDVPLLSAPGHTDLGLWNVYGNDAVPGPQAALEQIFGAPSDATLDNMIARFKTPTLRDLGQSAPYFHNGQADTLEAVTRHYIDFSDLARASSVRNADPQLSQIALIPADIEPLRAFLRALNEDYE